MADYTITRVSAKQPRSWSFTDKKTNEQVQMETYNVMVEGESEAVEVNRKPGDKPVTGEVLTGSLETTEYGRRFKKERQPYTPSKGGYQPKDEAAIKAMWSISQAIAWLGEFESGSDVTDIEPVALDLFNMVDRVKTGQPSGYLKAKEVAKQIKTHAEVDKVYGLKDEDEINLDDIPF